MGEIKQCDGSRADLQPDTGRLCKRTAAFPTASSTKSTTFYRFYKIYYLLCFLQDIIPATRFTKATTYYMFYKIYNLLYVKQNLLPIIGSTVQILLLIYLLSDSKRISVTMQRLQMLLPTIRVLLHKTIFTTCAA